MACHRTLNIFLVSISLLLYSVVWIFLLAVNRQIKPDGHVEIGVQIIAPWLDCSCLLPMCDLIVERVSFHKMLHAGTYFFDRERAPGILKILQSDWFRERAVFSYLLTTVMVTNYAKRRVKLRIERAKFQFVLIVFCNRAVLLFNFLIKKQCKNIPDLSFYNNNNNKL